MPKHQTKSNKSTERFLVDVRLRCYTYLDEPMNRKHQQQEEVSIRHSRDLFSPL